MPRGRRNEGSKKRCAERSVRRKLELRTAHQCQSEQGAKNKRWNSINERTRDGSVVLPFVCVQVESMAALQLPAVMRYSYRVVKACENTFNDPFYRY